MNEQDRMISGPDVLNAFAYGDSVPSIEMAALDQARELYGPGAQLRIEHTGAIGTSGISRRGKFCASAKIRCLNYRDES